MPHDQNRPDGIRLVIGGPDDLPDEVVEGLKRLAEEAFGPLREQARETASKGTRRPAPDFVWTPSDGTEMLAHVLGAAANETDIVVIVKNGQMQLTADPADVVVHGDGARPHVHVGDHAVVRLEGDVSVVIHDAAGDAPSDGYDGLRFEELDHEQVHELDEAVLAVAAQAVIEVIIGHDHLAFLQDVGEATLDDVNEYLASKGADFRLKN